MNSNRSLSEEEHLKEIVSLLAVEGRHYMACQVAHLAGILKYGAQSFLPILRWGYLLAKGHLSEREAVSLLTALYAEVRSASLGESGGKLLALLTQSRDGAWLAERFREKIEEQEERRKKSPIFLRNTDGRSQEGEGSHEEINREGEQSEDDPAVLPRPCR